MKWPVRFLLILTVLILVAGIGGIVYAVRARMEGNEYQFQIDAILAAARVSNGGEAVTDPARSVISSLDGARAVISPGNYTALSSYLRKDAVKPLFARIPESEALKIVFCDEAVLQAVPADETGDRVLVRLTSRNRTYTMHLRGGNLWTNLTACCMKGTYHDQNLPLE